MMHRVSARLWTGFLLLCAGLALTGCGQQGPYYYPQYEYGNRAVPPSGILHRVLATYTANGSGGGAEILDGERDIRSNVQDTHPTFFISGFSEAQPIKIFNYPAEQLGYVLNQTDGTLVAINYATEAAAGAAVANGFGAYPSSVAISLNTSGNTYLGGNTGNSQLLLSTPATNPASIALNVPNIYRVATSPSGSIMLAMQRNTNALYRVVLLSQTTTPVTPPGSIDCQPLTRPLYCLVPVAGSYDRPNGVYFSRDGSKAFILNCGPECGGTTASLTVLNTAALDENTLPTVNPLSAGAPSPLASIGVANPILVPGGVTTSISDGSTLYLAGQQLLSDGKLSGNLSTLNLSTYAITSKIGISDGMHGNMVFGDDNTLWIGAQQCANGERAAQNQNTNCLTRIALGSTPAATIVPAVTPGGSPMVTYPNADNNLYYYGSLTGICSVQNYHKVYTAYGGQIHAFNTATGAEIDNSNITVQGTVLDVSYMDATDDTAN